MKNSIHPLGIRDGIAQVPQDFILCGHTHLSMFREIESRIFVNPGSVGLPLDGDPHASYALYQDGRIKLRRAKYNVGKAINYLRLSTLPDDAVDRLAEILRTGRNVDVTIPSTST